MSLQFRAAGPGDTEQVSQLHADSWRRYYRGAYADSFLDGFGVADRRQVWSSRLAAPGNSLTLVAEEDAGLVGFVHTVFDDDDRWGSLLDNLHVTRARHRSGIGSALMTRAASAAGERAASGSLYVWVLEQNTEAQQFYRALGGIYVETAMVSGPGGVPSRLQGSPRKLRLSWPDASVLTRRSRGVGGSQAIIG